ncbi:hypothetical protein RB195_003233 [Necator americanus]|uniref:Uncharacterized protein n=1 Tax=Necator americanus TaxID=51031 RepID=A0ABR1DQF1_NECAM
MYGALEMSATSICPRSQLVGTISAPSSSILLLPATQYYPTQVVTGGINGEVQTILYVFIFIRIIEPYESLMFDCLNLGMPHESVFQTTLFAKNCGIIYVCWLCA